MKFYKLFFTTIVLTLIFTTNSIASDIYIGKHLEYMFSEINIIYSSRIFDFKKEYNIYDYFTENDINILSKLLWGEDRGNSSIERKAAVIWCVLNRLDSNKWESSIYDIVTEKYQFVGYNEDNPIEDNSLYIVKDVILRYIKEKNNETHIGRVLPNNYYWFSSKNNENIFYNSYKDENNIWDWSLESPYST